MHRRLIPALGLVAAIGLTSAGPANAEEYTILIYESPADLAARTDVGRAADYWNGYNAFAGELAQAGVLRGGSALSETTAVTVRGRGGADTAVSGARLGGYFVIDVADLDAARRWAAKAPAGAVAVEIRPHRPNPTMASSAMAMPR